MSRNGSSPVVQVAIALIGVAGSIAVAFITTGATFERELKANEQTVSSLKTSVASFAATKKSMEDELKAAQESLRAVRTDLATLESHVGIARDQLATLNTSVSQSSVAVNNLNAQFASLHVSAAQLAEIQQAIRANPKVIQHVPNTKP